MGTPYDAVEYSTAGKVAHDRVKQKNHRRKRARKMLQSHVDYMLTVIFDLVRDLRVIFFLNVFIFLLLICIF